MGKKGFILVLVAVLFGVLIYITYVRVTNNPVQKGTFLFGTYIRITAYGPGAGSAVDRALAEMARVEDLTASDRGPVAEINKNAGKNSVQVEKELFSLLRQVSRLSTVSGGYFNPVIGALVETWGFGYNGTGRLPAPKEITAALPLTDPELLVLDEKNSSVYLRSEGARLDLGGVAKGYAVDRAWDVLKSSGVKGALINGGESSIRALGSRPGGQPWRVAVSHPRKGEWIGILELPPGKAVGTSADTQRFFERNGRRYSHLLNPKTGYPPADVFSVTVVTDSALKSDLFSTALFVAEGKDRLTLSAGWQSEAVVVEATGEILKTPGFEILLRE